MMMIVIDYWMIESRWWRKFVIRTKIKKEKEEGKKGELSTGGSRSDLR